MQSLLHQLENNEAILLMYLSDELSAEDRAEVEQKLASDAGLAAELLRLRAVRDGAYASIGSADAAARLPVSQGVAVRRVTRMLRQWQIEQLKPRPQPEPVSELRFPWWSYPLTSAAVILIAFLVWWGHRYEPVPRPGPGAPQEMLAAGPQTYDEWHAEAILADLQESIDVDEDDLMRMATDARVDQLVRQLAAMSSASGHEPALPQEQQKANELDL